MLIMDVKKRNINLVKKAVTNLNILFDRILIDEFQDFRNNDYELINAFIKYSNMVIIRFYFNTQLFRNKLTDFLRTPSCFT